MTTVMDKDRHESSRKKRKAPLRLVDPRREVKALLPSMKGAAATAMMPLPAMLVAAAGKMPSPSKASEVEAARVAKMGGASVVSHELPFDDYLIEGVTIFDAHTGLIASGCCIWFIL